MCRGRCSFGKCPLVALRKDSSNKANVLLAFFPPLHRFVCDVSSCGIQEQEETFSLLMLLQHRKWKVNWDWEGAKVLGNLWGEVQPKAMLTAVGAALWGVKGRVCYRTMHWRVGQPVILLAWERAKWKAVLPDLNSFSRCMSSVRKSCFFTLLDLCACTQWT